MNVVVCVEQDLDTRVPFKVAPDGSVAQTEPDPIIALNPGDRAALELSMRLKEGDEACVVTALTLAPLGQEGALRLSLARGADRAIRVQAEASPPLDAFATATLLSRAVKGLEADLILCGHNGAASQVGPILAELLDLPQVTTVVGISIHRTARTVVADRRLEKGNREQVVSPLPAVLTVDPSAQTPRYISVRARLSALSRPIEHLALPSLIGEAEAVGDLIRTRVVRTAPPRPRPKKIFTPDSSLSAEDRLELAVSGGMAVRKGDLAEGDPRQLAARIVKFLRDQKLISR